MQKAVHCRIAGILVALENNSSVNLAYAEIAKEYL